MTYTKLGDLLVSRNAVTPEQLDTALELQKGTDKRLGDVLIENGIITEKALIRALQEQLNVDFVDLTSESIPVELARYVPKNIATRFRVVPFRLMGDDLYVAMVDPLNFIAVEEIKAASHKMVVPVIAARNAVDHAISTLYGNVGAARAIEDMRRESAPTAPVAVTVDDGSSAAPTIRFVNSVIERAVEERASDIHLEPQEDEMVVRMRIDGLLRKMLTVPANLQAPVTSRLKIMGGMNIAERRVPQDGRTNTVVHGRDIDLRISSLPTVYGEKIVIRLLDKETTLVDKSTLGLTGADLEKYNALLGNSSGVILIVGPTGSGKSTTMYTMIGDLAREEVNVVTLEDPVEYELPGISQCQINEKTGMTFANGLRSILRQDPDIISVGEIRDGETGTIAMRAAITGHLVLSTLHTNDAVSAIDRLADIGIEPYLVSSALKGVISQRLVRKICPHCRRAYDPTPEQLQFFGLPATSDAKFYRGAGCAECFHTGYHGRQAVYEILILNREEQSLITARAPHEELIKAVHRTDFVSMHENCRRLVLDGVTTAEEAFRAVNTTEEREYANA